VADLDGALEAFSYFQTPYCFIGHTHSPVMVAANCEKPYKEVPVISDEKKKRKQKREKVLVNVGSVGQPRDRDNRACWCLVDSDCDWIEFVRVEYDIERSQHLMREQNLPLFLIERLALGR
jgi:diadenosine tetraphosphatase ApaH/serine/threonine PP2A family protein phosphatase